MVTLVPAGLSRLPVDPCKSSLSVQASSVAHFRFATERNPILSTFSGLSLWPRVAIRVVTALTAHSLQVLASGDRHHCPALCTLAVRKVTRRSGFRLRALPSHGGRRSSTCRDHGWLDSWCRNSPRAEKTGMHTAHPLIQTVCAAALRRRSMRPHGLVVRAGVEPAPLHGYGHSTQRAT